MTIVPVPPKVEYTSETLRRQVRREALEEAFPDLKDKMVGCPATQCPEYEGDENIIGAIIVHLNDGHKWTRQQIAEWCDMLHRRGFANLALREDGEEET